MLEAKIRLIKAMNVKAPMKTVEGLFKEYDEAYKRLRKPSAHHEKDYVTLYFRYANYNKELK